MINILHLDDDMNPVAISQFAYIEDTPNMDEKSLLLTDFDSVSFEEIISSWRLVSGKLENVGKPPTSFHKWNLERAQWEDPRTLQDLKDAQWAQIKQARSQAEYAGFTWYGSIFDSDAISQQRINGAVSLALIAKQTNQFYSITWTLADNTLRVLSAEDMINVGIALGIHVQTTFNKGQQLQQQIEAATTKEEIEAITW